MECEADAMCCIEVMVLTLLGLGYYVLSLYSFFILFSLANNVDIDIFDICRHFFHVKTR